MTEPQSNLCTSPEFRELYNVSGANGCLMIRPSIFRIQCAPWVVIGGPYPMCPPGVFGVCLLEQTPDASKDGFLHLPIRDFSTPTRDCDVSDALKCTIEHLLVGRPVYVGCAAGWGRTGLFLSLLAKVAGEGDPVGFVRRNYACQAVETPEQSDYIDQFKVAGLRLWLVWKLLLVQQKRRFFQ